MSVLAFLPASSSGNLPSTHSDNQLMRFDGANTKKIQVCPYCFVDDNGVMSIQAHLLVGSTASYNARRVMEIRETFTGDTAASWHGGFIKPTISMDDSYNSVLTCMNIEPVMTLNTYTASQVNGIALNPTVAGSGSLVSASSVNAAILASSNAAITTGYIFSSLGVYLSTGATIGTAYGLYLTALKSASVTTAYGIYQLGTSDINYFEGHIGIGEVSPLGPIEITHITPYIYLHNLTEEDIDGGREGRICWRGEQSGGEESMGCIMEAAHDGSSNDEKFYWRILLNDGSDGENPTQVLKINSVGHCGINMNPTSNGILAIGGRVEFLQTAGAGTACRIENNANRLQIIAPAAKVELQSTADNHVSCFAYSAEGETKELYIHGYRTGDSNRSLEIGVGVDAADTASFDGVSNYYFDGNIGINEASPSALVELTHTAPYQIFHNSTEEDTDGGRESKLLFKGEQSGGEETTLASITVAHDGSSDDQKGYIQLNVNRSSDGDAPTASLKMDSDGHFCIKSANGSDEFCMYHDNVNAYLRWNDGNCIFQTDEGTNSNTYIDVIGKGTGSAQWRLYDQDEAEYVQITCTNARGYLHVGGTSPDILRLQFYADCNISMFEYAQEGETRELKIYGYRTGDAARSLEIGVGVDAADTASFDGVSNYLFDGSLDAIGDLTAGTIQADNGYTGSFTNGDGNTVTVVGGIITNVA